MWTPASGDFRDCGGQAIAQQICLNHWMLSRASRAQQKMDTGIVAQVRAENPACAQKMWQNYRLLKLALGWSVVRVTKICCLATLKYFRFLKISYWNLVLLTQPHEVMWSEKHLNSQSWLLLHCFNLIFLSDSWFFLFSLGFSSSSRFLWASR